MKKSNGSIFIGVVVAIIGVIAIVLVFNKETPQKVASTPVVKKTTPTTVEVAEDIPAMQPAVEVPDLNGVLTLPEEEVVDTETVKVLEDEPEPIHYYNGMDPEDQPRTFDRMSFVGLVKIPNGFVITGDAILTKEGWTLKEPEAGDEDKPRSGMIESPVMKLEFPSNALSSGWKEISPSGTEVLIEIAASPDGKNWTDWYPTTGAHMDGEIQEYNEVTFKRNPNYGYTLGDMVFFGVGKYQYYKYSMMLYSENTSAPLLSNFYVYLQDSTMGDGFLVEYDESRDMSSEDAS